MATEKLKFKIELYSVYYNKPPIAEIFIKNTDDKSVTNDTIANKNLFDYDSNKPILNINNSYFNNEKFENYRKPFKTLYGPKAAIGCRKAELVIAH